MLSRSVWLVLVMAALLAVGCPGNNSPSGDTRGKGGGDPAAVAEGKKLVLDSEPAGAKGVVEVKQNAKDGDEVVVVGRVGGEEKPFTNGKASFRIVDPKFKPADCECAWDYCDTPAKELATGMAVVKFVDAQGKTLPTEARELFAIHELTTVVVKGKAVRDDAGNLTVVGTGIFVRKDTN
jgi:hypothetical protein